MWAWWMHSLRVQLSSTRTDLFDSRCLHCCYLRSNILGKLIQRKVNQTKRTILLDISHGCCQRKLDLTSSLVSLIDWEWNRTSCFKNWKVQNQWQQCFSPHLCDHTSITRSHQVERQSDVGKKVCCLYGQTNWDSLCPMWSQVPLRRLHGNVQKEWFMPLL